MRVGMRMGLGHFWHAGQAKQAGQAGQAGGAGHEDVAGQRLGTLGTLGRLEERWARLETPLWVEREGHEGRGMITCRSRVRLPPPPPPASAAEASTSEKQLAPSLDCAAMPLRRKTSEVGPSMTSSTCV